MTDYQIPQWVQDLFMDLSKYPHQRERESKLLCHGHRNWIRLSAPKVKKSREEIFQDEVDKIRAKYEELLANMRDPTAQMPTPAATAKVQRILSAKLVESKEQWGCFETTTALEELEKAVLLFKEALKMTSAYLPHNSHPKKAHGDGFVAAMEKLSQNVLKRFPEPVLTHYRHLTYLKDRSMSGLASHPLQCVVV